MVGAYRKDRPPLGDIVGIGTLRRHYKPEVKKSVIPAQSAPPQEVVLPVRKTEPAETFNTSKVKSNKKGA